VSIVFASDRSQYQERLFHKRKRITAIVSVTLILAVRFPHHVLLNQGPTFDGMASPRRS
jgi:hypothetical protein